MFSSTGTVQFDPLKGTKHFDPGWMILSCDKQIADYYAWHLKRYGIEVNTSSPWGTHISVIKGDIVSEESWQKWQGAEVRFNYENAVRFDNGEHAWLDVWSQELCDLRVSLGLTEKNKYHLTVGRLKIKLSP